MAQPTHEFSFPWPILRVLLEGRSILDVPKLELRTMEDATNFIQAYGFDPGHTSDLELLWGVFEESVQFLERSLQDPRYPAVPEHLRTRKAVNDLRRVLLIASQDATGGEAATDQRFACAILRVMHVLVHLNQDPRLKYFSQVQNQILARLEEHLYVDPNDGATHLGKKDDGESIKLLFFKKKDRKDRDREIIKLLHKTESLAEEIYDRIGFRLVTETKFDALRAVRLLLKKNIISFPNVRPGRSRNRLVDINRLQFEIDRIETHRRKSGDSAPYVEKMIKRLESRIGYSRLGRSLINPHSSEYYRAIQFTCRELVKVKNPMFQVYQKLKVQVEVLHGGAQVLQDVFPDAIDPHEYVFFPYEIQIMDVRAYTDSIFGKSNHDEYRKKQLETARRRTFGNEDSH